MIHEEKIDIKRERESLTSTNNFYYRRKPQKPEEWDFLYRLKRGIVDMDKYYNHCVGSIKENFYWSITPWKVFDYPRYIPKNRLSEFSYDFFGIYSENEVSNDLINKLETVKMKDEENIPILNDVTNMKDLTNKTRHFYSTIDFMINDTCWVYDKKTNALCFIECQNFYDVICDESVIGNFTIRWFKI